MARELNEIQQAALDIYAQESSFDALEVLTPNEQTGLSNLTSQSRVANWRKNIYVLSLQQYYFEIYMDEYERNVQARLDAQRVHKISWYQELLLNYQHGAVYDNLGNYDNTNRTDAQVEAMRVFKHAAITRTISDGAIVLRCKVAGESNGQFTAATAAQVTAASAYMRDNTDAGTLSLVTTGAGDDLKLKITVYFDPTILDSDGKRLDGTNDTPVIEATNTYLQQKELNDSYVKGDHEHAMRQVEGVRIVEVTEVASKYAANTYTSTGIANAGPINQIRVADSGYFIVDTNELEITYEPATDV
jgi:hypothetical protein